MPKLIDLTGQRFNRLLVIERAKENKNNRPAWVCKCDCGNITTVKSNDLRAGKTQSCGCLNQELRVQRNIERNSVHVGDVFGKLTVIKELGYEYCNNEDHRRKIVLCQCECGRVIEVNTHLLKGSKRDCGCSNMSYGEQKVMKLLKQYNIPFETQKTFDSCIFPDTGYRGKFDFFVNNQYIIEYNGAQHYLDSEFFNSEATKKRDQYKYQWCRDNNIPLIIIPYTHLDNMVIDDLLLDKSQFVLK